MTENELRLELQCYKTVINPRCDIEHLTISELAEFITIFDELKNNEKRLKLNKN